MNYEVSLGEELRLEAQIREVVAHPDDQMVRNLCASLVRQNYHQQRLLSGAVGRVSELELILLLGAVAKPGQTDVFMNMAGQLLKELGVS